MTTVDDIQPDVRAAWQQLPDAQRMRLLGFLAWMAVLTLLFMRPLVRLVTYAAGSYFYSYILLVPVVAGYLLYTDRLRLLRAERGSAAGAVLMAGTGIAALAVAAFAQGLSVNDDLALKCFGFLSFAAAGAFLFLGAKWVAAHAFPVAFLIFMVPLPDAAVDWLERASVVASAEAAAVYFNIMGTPLVRHGTVFELPGIALQVGQECSGIHSTWVLFITSLLAAHMFLAGGWRKAVLVAFVIPLGILRNGLRILVIGLLCVHVSPSMIESVIHHRGGPIFFVLSLGPLFLLLWWLRRSDSRQ